jgi:prepilin-type N-terminal cleavage/methylation domain-containing protein
MPSSKPNSGFTLIELLITIAILAVLMTVTFVFVFPALAKARDARRKFELTNLGRFLVMGCPLPSSGAGDYDLAPLIEELKAAYPRYADALAAKPKDPSRGTEEETFYRYVVSDATGTLPKKCALYANLENSGETVTLPGLAVPTVGGGTGVFRASADGWNGTPNYFQISN